MGKGTVSLRHLMSILTLLNRCSLLLEGVSQFGEKSTRPYCPDIEHSSVQSDKEG